MLRRSAPLIGIPIKPFGVAKGRLHPRLDAAARSELGRSIAAHTVQTARATGAEVVVVTGNDGVHRWARRIGIASIAEGPPGSGLDGAAAAVQNQASRAGRAWLVIHADLPAISPADVRALLAALEAGPAVIAPSHDGGTSALGAIQAVPTAYGTGSFHRHLRRLPAATVVCRPGLALDLDTIADLENLLADGRYTWISRIVEAIDSGP